MKTPLWYQNETNRNWWNLRLWVDYSPAGLNQENSRDVVSWVFHSTRLTAFLGAEVDWVEEMKYKKSQMMLMSVVEEPERSF